MKRLIVYAPDVGSIKRNRFGWTRSSEASAINENGTDIAKMMDRIVSDLQHD